MSLAAAVINVRTARPSMRAKFFIISLVWGSGSKCELDARQKRVLILRCDRAGSLAAAIEPGVLVVQVQLNISVQIPIESNSERKCALGGTGSGIKRKNVAGDCKLAHSAHDLPRSPASSSWRKWTPRRNAPQRVRLACQYVRRRAIPTR